MTTLLNPVPRWPGAALICEYENMLAFQTVAECNAFTDSLITMKVHATWRCPVCRMVHRQMTGIPPSGATSGTGREFTPGMPRYKREGRTALEL